MDNRKVSQMHPNDEKSHDLPESEQSSQGKQPFSSLQKENAPNEDSVKPWVTSTTWEEARATQVGRAH